MDHVVRLITCQGGILPLAYTTLNWDSMGLSDFFSSLMPVVHADAVEAPAKDDTKSESKEEVAGAPAQEADEETPEPEDLHPTIREECKEEAKCKPLTSHFLHCQEKVESGHGFKHEDCVEELFHMMHCVDNCAAPKIFAKLR